MNTTKRISLCIATVFTVILGLVMMPSTHAADEDVKPAGKMQPVEDDVHEFMEYAFEPFFHELKKSLAAPPKDKRAWVPVKANSLILAENGNLLMLRGPDEGKAAWNQLSVELRDQGKLLYQAAKKRDFETARRHYEVFVSKCNACHQKFAEGEHIQKP